MAEYSPSKIIKDGNTYNFRDTTKIPLAGSNQISGSLIPATTNAYDLGGSSYQWNNAYIKSLTINGVACGDILTHNVSEFVNVSSGQIIGGQKIFTASPRVTKTFPDIALNISDCDVTEIPTEAKSATLFFRDKNNKNLAYIVSQQRTNGTKRMCLRTHRTDNINNYYSVNLDSDGYFYPEQNNSLRLGTPALQWNNTYTRNILIDNDINIASSLINKTSNSGVLTVRGGINDSEGASLSLYGKDYGGSPGLIGNIYMTAYGNSDYTNFRIYPNGTMSVYNNSTATTKNVAMQEDVIPRSGGAVMTDYFLGRSVNTGSFMISGGTSWSSGGSLEAFGSNHSSYAGRVRLQPALSNSNFKTMNLEPSGTWSWSGTACQITSDQRLKQQITKIDDKLLDAWGDVELVQFKYNESVDTKGKSARLHTGYVVQQIDSACKQHGVDVSAYGLYCHEEYPEETEEVEVEQKDGTKTKERKVIRKANEHYSLRYTEALIVECKYLRRCIARLTARIEELEKDNNVK